METSSSKKRQRKTEKKELKREKKRAKKEKKKIKKRAKKDRKKDRKKQKQEKKKSKNHSSSSTASSSSEDEDHNHNQPPPSATNTNNIEKKPRMNWMSEPFDMKLTGREEKPKKIEPDVPSKKEIPKVYGLYDPKNPPKPTIDTDKKNKLLNMAAKWKAKQAAKQAAKQTATTSAAATTTSSSATATSVPAPSVTAPSTSKSTFWKPGTKPRASSSSTTTKTTTTKTTTSTSQRPTLAPPSLPPPVANTIPKPSSQNDRNKNALAALRQRMNKPQGPPPSSSSSSSSTKTHRQLAPLERADLRNGSKQGRKFHSEANNDPSQQKYTGLKKLLEEGSGNMDEIYARNIIKQGKKFKTKKSSKSGRDEEEDVDVSMYNTKSDNMTQRKKDEMEMQRQAHYNKQQEDQASRDRYNMRNPSFQRHRVVSTGEHSYMMIPPAGQQLTWGHVMIVPIDSVHTLVQTDENVYEEIRKYQSVMETMLLNGEPGDYEKEPLGVIYLETAITVNRPHHTVLHCIPISYDILEDLPIYFKKALSEVGDEWSTHKKILNTSRMGKTIRHSIPPNFPYFHVEWAGGRYPSGGMAHVIEGHFQMNFGQDIVRGLLGQNPAAFGRKDKSRRNNQNVEEKREADKLKAALVQFDNVGRKS